MTATAAEPRFPPTVALTMVSLAAVVISGVWLGAYAPRPAPLGLPTVLLVVGVILWVVGLVLLTRVRDFSWATFANVARWALLAYVVAAGMIAFAFVKNDVRGPTLAVVLGSLVMFALDVPTLIATTAARYANAPPGPAGPPPGAGASSSTAHG
jgi:hypothetical protein